MSTTGLLALMAGAMIALQASMNAKLGLMLNNSVIATVVAFACSCFFSLILLAVLPKPLPALAAIKSVPIFLWFTGGLLAATGVGLFYFLIPKMGIGPMMSYALTGQLLVALAASHWGWFNLPEKPITPLKLVGACSLVLGILLINKE